METAALPTLEASIKEATRFLEHTEAIPRGYTQRSDIPKGEVAWFMDVKVAIDQKRACQEPVDKFLDRLKYDMRRIVEAQKLNPDAFNWDMISKVLRVQVRNGILRSDTEARRTIDSNQQKCQLDMFLQDKYDLESPHTVESIRLGRR
jgi:hypothetical protein